MSGHSIAITITVTVGDVKRAAECTGTYLHINPTDDVAQFNKGYYGRQHQVIEEDFTPRKVRDLICHCCNHCKRDFNLSHLKSS